MSLIIEDVKRALAVEPTNLDFDGELYTNINAAKSILVQLGVIELDIDITSGTEWPVFNSDIVGELAKQHLVLKVKSIFDPTASETIGRAYESVIRELADRIVHEIDEEAA